MEQLKYCARCRTYHNYNEPCPNRPQFKHHYKKDSDASKLRGSQAWRNASKYVLEQRDNNQCQLCHRGLLRTINEDELATEVHHIVPIAEGGELTNANNLIGLCKWHHRFVENKKEYRELLLAIAKEQNEKYKGNPLIG